MPQNVGAKLWFAPTRFFYVIFKFLYLPLFTETTL
jgi:hypothetical protein